MPVCVFSGTRACVYVFVWAADRTGGVKNGPEATDTTVKPAYPRLSVLPSLLTASAQDKYYNVWVRQEGGFIKEESLHLKTFE